MVQATPAPSIADVLRTTLEKLIRDTATEYLKERFPRPGDIIQAFLAETCTGLDLSVKEWKKSSTHPGEIPKDYFTIQGVDYTVAGKAVVTDHLDVAVQAPGSSPHAHH
jgi:hypothetical protein